MYLSRLDFVTAMVFHTPRTVIVSLAALAVVAMTGCAERPTDHIAAAVNAVAEAQAGLAATYAPEDLRRLEAQAAALATATAEQDSQLTLLRDYTAIDRMAIAVSHTAAQLVAAATEQHASAKATAEAAIAEAQDLLDESRTLVATLKTDRKLGLIRRQAVDVSALVQSMAAARDAFAHEDFVAAEARARAITAQASLVTGHMRSVVARLDDHAGTRFARN